MGYIAILRITGFLACAWLATRVSKLAGISSMVLEITAGVVLGPSVVGLIGDEYAQCDHKTHSNCKVPADFEQRLVDGLTMGADVDRILKRRYCSYWEHHAVAHAESGDEHGNETANYQRLSSGDG